MQEFIVLVDDEIDILDLLSLHLKKVGYGIKAFQNADSFLQFLKQRTPDLLILDLMLPDLDGMEVCKQLRQESGRYNFPIIMLTAKDEELDKILGLELGADDYITKPFSIREVIARVKAVLRRSKVDKQPQAIQVDGELIIDLEKYQVTVNNKPVDLTRTEFNLLKILAENRGIVYSRDRLLDLLWGNDKIVLTRTIDVHIKNLREKLGATGAKIDSIRGVGYRFK